MSKFRKKPVEVEAVLYTGFDAPGFAETHGLECLVSDGKGDYQQGLVVIVPTAEGDMRILPGEWLITGINGEKYPCKPDIFEATYEPVEARNEQQSGERKDI